MCIAYCSVLFTLVSLPIAWGYIVINMAAGLVYEIDECASLIEKPFGKEAMLIIQFGRFLNIKLSKKIRNRKRHIFFCFFLFSIYNDN